jgi:lycopene cyclase CruA
VVLRNMASDRPETYRARLLLDGMGSTSPLALLRHAGRPFAGVCPTVGTVARGFEAGSERQQVDPTLGDILISVADTQDGKQMIWEGFPGRGDELTVYLFYYAALRKAGRARAFLPASASGHAPRGPLGNGKHNGHAAGVVGQPRYSLLALFEQYFALLPSYKRPGPDFAHVKPVYGYIPGRHSVHMQEAPLLTGVLPVGDAAAQQSPLTFCGFGSHIRNLRRTTGLLDTALRRDLLAPDQLRHISAFQVNVSLNWVFSRFMQPWHDPHTVNELQNAFLGALQDLGDGLASRFFRDRMRWHDYNQIVWQTMMRYKQVFIIVWPVLGVAGVRQWAQDYVRFSLSAATAAVAQAAGRPGEYALTRIAELVSPAAALRVQAQYAEWRAMDWL